MVDKFKYIATKPIIIFVANKSHVDRVVIILADDGNPGLRRRGKAHNVSDHARQALFR